MKKEVKDYDEYVLAAKYKICRNFNIELNNVSNVIDYQSHCNANTNVEIYRNRLDKNNLYEIVDYYDDNYNSYKKIT